MLIVVDGFGVLLFCRRQLAVVLHHGVAVEDGLGGSDALALVEIALGLLGFARIARCGEHHVEYGSL
ncbi:MAG: hypothetical protein ACOCNZ_04870 [Prevotella sp.]